MQHGQGVFSSASRNTQTLRSASRDAVPRGEDEVAGRVGQRRGGVATADEAEVRLARPEVDCVRRHKDPEQGRSDEPAERGTEHSLKQHRTRIRTFRATMGISVRRRPRQHREPIRTKDGRWLGGHGQYTSVVRRTMPSACLRVPRRNTGAAFSIYRGEPGGGAQQWRGELPEQARDPRLPVPPRGLEEEARGGTALLRRPFPRPLQRCDTRVCLPVGTAAAAAMCSVGP